MRRIFIYYSLSGNGDFIADKLKDKDIDIRKVYCEKELPKNMFFRIVTGGFLAGINYRSKLKDFDKDISLYDEVIIGSPIWNGRLSCPINSVLDELDFGNKKVTFVLYSGSGESLKVRDNIGKKYPNAKVLEFREPLKNGFDIENII